MDEISSASHHSSYLWHTERLRWPTLALFCFVLDGSSLKTTVPFRQLLYTPLSSSHAWPTLCPSSLSNDAHSSLSTPLVLEFKQSNHCGTSPTEGIGRGMRSTGPMCLCYVHQWACVFQGWAQTSNSSEDTLGHAVFEQEGLGQGLMPF